MTSLSAFMLVLASSLATGAERLSIEPGSVTISGISSGGFMAVQMQVAYSRTIRGAGVIAGGIFNCADGQASKAIQCMKRPESILPEVRATDARRMAAAGLIDPVDEIATHRVYIFQGTKDATVRPVNAQKLAEFYREFISNPDQIRTETTLAAGHGFPTEDQGAACEASASPWLNDCDYDGAGAILKTLYGSLNPRGAADDTRLRTFSQRELILPEAAMLDTGYVYVPKACEDGGPCRLHVALHGCRMNSESVQDQFARRAGYNAWAESNRIIVVYPQAAKRLPGNPNGCWDWFGFTGKEYATQNGPQMRALKAIIGSFNE